MLIDEAPGLLPLLEKTEWEIYVMSSLDEREDPVKTTIFR